MTLIRLFLYSRVSRLPRYNKSQSTDKEKRKRKKGNTGYHDNMAEEKQVKETKERQSRSNQG
jgi:hypothetical protein